jgi:hypothetical protein
MSNPEALQRRIDESLQRLGTEIIQQIRLAPGSDVTDLTMNVDVDVVVNSQPRREFSIVSYRSLNEIFDERVDDEVFGETNTYTTGGPLIIAKVITGETIVEGILQYLQLETSKAEKPWNLTADA